MATNSPSLPESVRDEEKPVREKLRDAAISSQRGSQSPDSSDSGPRQFTPVDDESPTVKQTVSNGRAKPARKRSLEDLKEPESGVSNLDAPATPSSGTHARKKSKEQREGQNNKAAKRNTEPSVREEDEDPPTPKSGSDRSLENSAMSPRRKRSADDMDSQNTRMPKVAATEQAQKARRSLDEDRPALPGTASAKTATDSSSTSKPAYSYTASQPRGFGNTDAVSPFAWCTTCPASCAVCRGFKALAIQHDTALQGLFICSDCCHL